MTKRSRAKIPVSKKAANKKEPLLLKNHKQAFLNGWHQLLQTPLSTITTCLMIAVTLVLTTTMLLSLQVFRQIADNLNSSNQVTLYLKANTPDAEALSFVNELKQNSMVAKANYISKDAALKELSEEEPFKNSLVDVQENPLPSVVEITFTTQEKEEITNLIQELSRNSLVEAVHLNSQWFERVFAILKLGNRITYLLSALFSIGVLFIVSHTIQQATSKNYQEMTILELIGATSAYIRRPFLYIGALIGLGSGIVCMVLISVLFAVLKQPLLDLLQSYSWTYPQQVSSKQAMLVILFSTFLGWLGSWIAFYKYSKLHHN